MPRVHGQPLDKMPDDLYIPPDALEVFLDAFEGPLDLLLYLIRRQNLNILDIPVLKITQQYMEYIALMRDLRLELAAEYLVMAAMLAEIKSRILLPRPPLEERARAIRAWSWCAACRSTSASRRAAENLDALPRVGREIFMAQARPGSRAASAPLPMPDAARADAARSATSCSAPSCSRSTRSRASRCRCASAWATSWRASAQAPAQLHRPGRSGRRAAWAWWSASSRSSSWRASRMIDVVQEMPFAPLMLAGRACARTVVDRVRDRRE